MFLISLQKIKYKTDHFQDLLQSWVKNHCVALTYKGEKGLKYKYLNLI